LLLTGSLALSVPAADQQPAKVEIVKIGTSGTLQPKRDSAKTDQSALNSLKGFIKDETGLNTEIVHQDSWQELADNMAKGNLHLGVFQGYEFAWAQGKQPELKPLALAFNVHRYPVACVVVNRDNPAMSFADLKGQSLDVPDTSDGYLTVFVTHNCKAAGKDLQSFFSKLASSENFEEALDQVVDGALQVTAVSQSALEGYQRRKPGRFNKLKEIARSQPFPPVVVAHYGSVLDEATLKRFQDGVLGATSNEKGQTVLTLFHLTGFETAPEDFGKVVGEVRKVYPPALPEIKNPR
jgi:ABC-type phosphate/phosphonate transport system substrate-binding protein